MTEEQIDRLAAEFHDHAHAENRPGLQTTWDLCPPWQRNHWRRVATKHLQRVDAAVRAEREAIAQMLEDTACRPGTGALLLASATRIRQRGTEGA